MKLIILSLSIFCFFVARAQNGIIGDGFAAGWNNSDILGFDSGVSGTRILTRNPSGTGLRYFRLVRNWGGNLTQFGPFSCADADWTAGANIEYLNMPACGNGAFFIDCPNATDNYVFKTRSGEFGNSFVYFRIQGIIRTIASVSTPITVTTNTPYDVDAEIDGALSTGQQVYLRYTSNNFSSSTVVPMTGSGTSYSAQIPGFTLGTNVIYYVFTSGDNPSVINHGNADLYTINLNNNEGSNFSYTVQAPLHVSILQFSAIEKDSEVRLSADIEYVKPLQSVTFQRMSKNENNKPVWMDIFSVSGIEVNSRLEFTDKDIHAGTHYYRLAITDTDAGLYYSPMQKVHIKSSQSIDIFPNPFKQVIYVRGFSEYAENKIVISDLLGRIILESNVNDDFSISNVTQLAEGIYSLQLISRSGQVLHKQLIMKY